jgi:Tfp pilus assembly protein FimT
MCNRRRKTEETCQCLAPSAGFTIAELMLVVIIIALIAGFGGGMYVGTYKNILARTAAKDLVLAAKYARMLAIEKQQAYKIEFDTENNTFWLATSQYSQESGQTEQAIVRDLYSKPVELSNDVTFEDIQITPVSSEVESQTETNRAIVFSPNGTAQTAIIQIGDGKNHYTVSISASTGRAKMYPGTTESVTMTTIDLEQQ